MGFLLLKAGFVWFKDWYFPEGFYEGSPKIEAEKALNDEHWLKSLRTIKEEVEKWVEKRGKKNLIEKLDYIESLQWTEPQVPYDKIVTKNFKLDNSFPWVRG